MSSLLEILRSNSEIVSDENAAIIHLNIISDAGHRIVYYYTAITLITNIKQTKVLKCDVCNNICLFPIVFSCCNVICNCYDGRHYKLINYLQFN